MVRVRAMREIAAKKNGLFNFVVDLFSLSCFRLVVEFFSLSCFLWLSSCLA